MVRTKKGIQIIIGKGYVGLLNLKSGQNLTLTPDQARAFGLEEEATLAERMKDE